MHLVERNAELGILRALFADCLDGRSGVSIISGACDTGKTALLCTFAEEAIDSGAVFIRANASPMEKELSCGVLEQLLRSPDLPVASAERAARWLDEAATPPPLAAEPAGPAADALASALRELWEILRDLAERQPVVIGIDDVHYADEPSLRILLYLLRRLRSARLLTVLTECPESRVAPTPVHDELFGEPHSRQLRLAPLTEHGVAALLAGHVDYRTAHRLAPDFHQASAGHPSLVCALLEDFLAERKADAPALVPGEAFGRATLSFLQRHEVPVVEVARAIAILRTARPVTFLSRLLDMDTASVEQAVHTLSAARILDGTGFCHAAVQAAVVSRISTDQSRTLHERAAALLHAEGATVTEVADHVIAANTDAPWAIQVLLDAAEHALAGDDPGMAIGYLKAAYEMCDDDRRPAIAARLADAEWRVDPGAVLRHLPEFHSAVREDLLDVNGSVTPVTALLWHGRVSEAVDLLATVTRSQAGHEQALADGADNLASPQLWLSYLYPELCKEGAPGSTAPRSGDFQPAELLAQHDEAARLMAGLLDRKDGDPVAAEAVLERTRLGPQTFAQLSVALATLIYDDRLDRAAECCDDLVAQAAARRSPTWQALFTAQRAMIHFRQGQLAAADRKAEAALAMIPPKSWGVAVGLPISCAVLAKTAMGEVRPATDLFTIPVPEEMSRTSIGLHYLYARGRHHLATGRLHAALYDFRECDRGTDLPTIEPWRIGAAEALLRLGDTSGARQLVDEQLALVGPEQKRTLGIALRVRAAAIEGPAERASLLKEAVRHLGSSSDRLELSYAIADLGETYARLGEHKRARELTHESNIIARQCRGRARNGTAVDRREAKIATLVNGKRPARPAVQLSESERRVAALAADGYTNREISGMLYITVSTVEQHLTKVYRKLNVKRFDLKSALHQIGS